jgi:hypothetical protein
MYVRCNEHAAIDRASLWIFLFQEKLLGQLARVFGRKCVFSAASLFFVVLSGFGSSSCRAGGAADREK